MVKGKPLSYKEGWIEFKKKRIAKQVADNLNGQPMAVKRRSRLAGSIWTMKYLHKFKWTHLTEQMNYEKTTRNQRLMLEMSKVKKESDFFAAQMDEHKRRSRKGEGTSENLINKRKDYYQSRQNQVRESKASSSSTDTAVDTNLLSRIFT